MKKKLIVDALIIVEGSNDVSYISSFIDSFFIITNGYDLNEQKIQFINEASKKRKVLFFTDPDDAGKQIRNKLKTYIKSGINIEIPRNSRKNYTKSGVAESAQAYIIDALTPYSKKEAIKRVDYHLSSIISLSSSPLKTRQKIIEKYRLIDGNNNSLENQLNILMIPEEEIANIGKE